MSQAGGRVAAGHEQRSQDQSGGVEHPREPARRRQPLDLEPLDRVSPAEADHEADHRGDRRERDQQHRELDHVQDRVERLDGERVLVVGEAAVGHRLPLQRAGDHTRGHGQAASVCHPPPPRAEQVAARVDQEQEDSGDRDRGSPHPLADPGDGLAGGQRAGMQLERVVTVRRRRREQAPSQPDREQQPADRVSRAVGRDHRARDGERPEQERDDDREDEAGAALAEAVRPGYAPG
ncbi:MAG TPA: hypothetical protein VGI72_01265, partial [Gaiellales bacterium]